MRLRPEVGLHVVRKCISYFFYSMCGKSDAVMEILKLPVPIYQLSGLVSAFSTINHGLNCPGSFLPGFVRKHI